MKNIKIQMDFYILNIRGKILLVLFCSLPPRNQQANFIYMNDINFFVPFAILSTSIKLLLIPSKYNKCYKTYFRYVDFRQTLKFIETG